MFGVFFLLFWGFGEADLHNDHHHHHRHHDNYHQQDDEHFFPTTPLSDRMFNYSLFCCVCVGWGASCELTAVTFLYLHVVYKK